MFVCLFFTEYEVTLFYCVCLFVSSCVFKDSSFSETSLVESDNTDYSDLDYVPDSESSSGQQSDELDLLPKKVPTVTSAYPCPGHEMAQNKKPAKVEKRKRKYSTTTDSTSSTPKKRRDKGHSSSIKIVPNVNTKSKRVYNKRNYCFYCAKPTSKIARHLQSVHGNEKEVASAFSLPKGIKERRTKLNILRRKGNFAHNATVVKKGAGELQVCYRPQHARSAAEFIHCFYCQGLYSKRTLWKHVKICPAKESQDDICTPGKQRIRAKCALKTAVVRDIGEGLKNLLSCMLHDEVTEAIHNDELLLQFGQHLYDLNGSKSSRHDYIRQRLRELGRLLVIARKKTNIQGAVHLIYPTNFNSVVSAVRELAGYDSKKNTFQKPSLALKIGHSLTLLSELVENDNLISAERDPKLLEFAREFKTIKSFKWKAMITRGATTTMAEQKWNAPLMLPFTEDVKKLDIHMDNNRIIIEKMLKANPCTKNYAELAKLVLAQVIIFNRRREGEVSRMELATFIRRNASQLNEDVATCLSPLENKMCDFFTRLEIRGKRGRGVPVLLKPSMVSSMELLAKTREKCGVLKENIYMFARPGTLSAYRGGECIQKYAKDCGAKNPDSLTSTKLRKHIATMSQVLNLQENEADQLANFLGHDIRVHRHYYRLPQGTLQLAKMSKVLLAVENGTLSQYKGQALDDITIDPEGMNVHILTQY